MLNVLAKWSAFAWLLAATATILCSSGEQREVTRLAKSWQMRPVLAIPHRVAIVLSLNLYFTFLRCRLYYWYAVFRIQTKWLTWIQILEPRTIKDHLYPVLWTRICMFLGLPDPDPSLFVRIWIRILPSRSKKVRKSLISNIFFSSFDFFYLWRLTNHKCTFKKIIRKTTLKKGLIFCSILSATDEKSRIRIRKSAVRIRKSAVRIRGSGSLAKRQGSTTLYFTHFAIHKCGFFFSQILDF